MNTHDTHLRCWTVAFAILVGSTCHAVCPRYDADPQTPGVIWSGELFCLRVMSQSPLTDEMTFRVWMRDTSTSPWSAPQDFVVSVSNATKNIKYKCKENAQGNSLVGTCAPYPWDDFSATVRTVSLTITSYTRGESDQAFTTECRRCYRCVRRGCRRCWEPYWVPCEVPCGGSTGNPCHPEDDIIEAKIPNDPPAEIFNN